MMHTDIAVTGLSFTIAVAGILVIAALWRDYWVDRARNDLFALRDEMFMYAFEQDILDHAGYRNLRLLINSMIRYCHHITVARFIATALINQHIAMPQRNVVADWQRAISGLPTGQRKALVVFHQRMVISLAVYAIKRTIVLYPVFWLIGRAIILRATWKKAAGSRVDSFVRRDSVVKLMEIQAATLAN